jgi:predicted ATPase
MIEHVKIEKLNGKYDYDLTFNRDINIITGRNGAGKTTLMKLLWAAVSGNLSRLTRDKELYYIDFEMKIFDDENIFSFEKSAFRFGQQRIKSLFFPTFRRIEGGFGAILGKLWYEIHLADNRRILDEEYHLHDKKYVFTHKIICAVGTSDIAALIKSKYADISAQIRDLEEVQNKFTTDLIHNRNGSDADAIFGKIDDKINETNEKKNTLLNPFTVLGELVAQFLDKEKTLSYEELISIVDSEQLSSGEKQMLSLLSYCIFYENAIIFIDEPELSLHVDWQRLFVPTLLKLNTSNQYFMATHSPFIYSRYPDKEINLDENRGGE